MYMHLISVDILSATGISAIDRWKGLRSE